ncbi:MAG: hypothetical protein PVH61_40545 [Candidatus Aminicenantes bacterium]|jgi:hypothetical protein
MNSKSACKTITCLVVLILPIFSTAVSGQEARLQIKPYLDGITSIKDGYLELGPEFKKGSLIIRPLLRLSLIDKGNSIVQLDQEISSWISMIAVELDLDRAKESGPIAHFRLGLQMEWGRSKFSYFPGGNIENRERVWKESLAFELKGMWYSTMGKPYAVQWAPQCRIRYSRIWEKSNEIGVVFPSRNGGPGTVTNLVLEPPRTWPILSAALALPYYPGKGQLSYSPAIYFNFIGDQNGHNPFGNAGRLRIETWIFYYPSITAQPNVRIGVAPFLILQTHGENRFDQWSYGVVMQIKIGTNFLHFF